MGIAWNLSPNLLSVSTSPQNKADQELLPCAHKLGQSINLRIIATFNTGTTPIEDDFHISLIHGPGISDQNDHLEFTDADSSVTTR